MLEAAFWGLVTAGSLWVGAALAAFGRLSQRVIGLAMAFGAGALIAAVAYELVAGRVRDGSQARGDRLRLRRVGLLRRRLAVDRLGGEGRKSMTGEAQLAGSASAIVLGTVLDGIPESFVLGASLVEEGVVPVAVVVGVFVSNVPEALSGSAGLLAGRLAAGTGLRDVDHGRRRRPSSRPSGGWLLDRQRREPPAAPSSTAFAAGALLVMLADTLMPEAFELGGREAGLLTASASRSASASPRREGAAA